jgi:hypothetical protein
MQDQYQYVRNPNDTQSFVDLLNDKEESEKIQDEVSDQYLNTVNTVIDNHRSMG